MATNDETEELMQSHIAAYALGVLEPDDVTALEAHLPGCTPCRTELAALQRAVQALDLVAAGPEVSLPAGHAERFAQKLAAAAPGPHPLPVPAAAPAPLLAHPARHSTPARVPVPSTRRPWWAAQGGWLAAAVLAALFVASALWAVSLQNETSRLQQRVAQAQDAARQAQAERDRLQQDITQVHNQLQQTNDKLVRLQEQYAQLDQDRVAALAVLSAPGVVAHPLTGTAALPGVTATLWIDPATNHGLLITHNLPPPTDDRIYELWLIAGQPVAAGTFAPGPDNTAWLLVNPDQPFSAYQVTAITDEPKPGGSVPKGQIVLQGNL